MEKVTVICNGESIQVEKGTSLMDFFSLGESLNYSDNPVIGAFINGEYKSLHFSLYYKTTVIEPIHLFSDLGKRIYRHSICYLLACAVSKLYPESHLEIGHSLGDGYFFHLTDRAVTNEDIKALNALMKDIVKANKKITREKIPYIDALNVFSGRKFRHASELLSSRNDGDITVYTLDDYTDSAYEPLVPCTSVLSVWKLDKYKEGMLLRYPQSRDYSKINVFNDNPLLFSVFKQTARENKILRCESLGQLNDLIINGEAGELIQLSESMYNTKIMKIVEDIKKKGKVRIIFMSGPSSSGKTTTSLKLGLQLKTAGYDPVKISLDDYYFSRELVPVDSDGNKDYEALEALDIAFFKENMKDLLSKGRTRLPHFSFKENKRYMDEEFTEMKENTVLIVEGIHGLNPVLSEDIDPAVTYKIYISALTSMIIDDHNRISTTDNRIIRRLVRDHRTRGIRTEETLSMWPSVERGEKNHIFPYQNNADVMINSALPYELAALAPQAVNLLRSVKPDDKYAFATARRLLKFLELIYTIPVTEIPSDSVTREFLGGSVFGAV